MFQIRGVEASETRGGLLTSDNATQKCSCHLLGIDSFSLDVRMRVVFTVLLFDRQRAGIDKNFNLDRELAR